MSQEKIYEKKEILVKFMSIGSMLAGDTYDEKGNKIKSHNEPFSKKDINELKSKGIEKLYYVQYEHTEKSDEVVEKSNEKVAATKKSIFLSDIKARPKVLLCHFDNSMLNYFIPRLTANGMALNVVDKNENVKQIAKDNWISHLLVDIDGAEWISFLEDTFKIKHSFHLFIFYGNSSREIFNNFNKKGIVNHSYDKGMNQKELVKNVINDINLTDPYFSKRNHIKILLSNEDNVKVDIYISKSMIIRGSGYSISPLELVITLTKTLKGELYNFSVGDKLDRISLKIIGQIVLTQGEIIDIDRKSQQITIKFTHRSESLLGSVGRFIIEKLKKNYFAI